MRRIRLAALLALSLGLWLAAPAGAGERRAHPRPKSGHVERTITRTGPDGVSRTSQHDTSWQRGDGQWTRQDVRTGPNGGVTTRSASGVYDRETRTLNKDVTLTRPDGTSSSKHVTRQVTPVTESSPAAR